MWNSANTTPFARNTREWNRSQDESCSLPAIIPRNGGARTASIGSMSLNPRPPNASQASAMKPSEMMDVIENQRRELQARTDSVNAIQRNFERLSEMYRGDRTELEQLRREMKQIQERDDTSESERKVLVAMRVEFESLLQSHKELRETSQREQQALKDDAKELQRRLQGQQEITTQLQDAVKEGNEKLRRTLAELSGTTRQVLQFTAEVRGRVTSLMAEGVGASHSRDGGSDNTVAAALNQTWDCVDAVCIAWRKAKLEGEQTVATQLKQQHAAAQTLFSECEGMVRRALRDEEAAWREWVRTAERGAQKETERRRELARQHDVLAALAQARSETHELQQKHAAAIASLQHTLNDAQARLHDAQQQSAALRQQREEDAAAHREAMQQQAARLRDEMQKLAGRQSSEEVAQQRAHAAAMQMLRQEHELALREVNKRLKNDHETKEQAMQGRIDSLEEEIAKLTASELARRKEEAELCKTHAASRDTLTRQLAATTNSHCEAVLQHEASVRGCLAEAERAQREALLRGARDHRETLASLTRAVAVAAASAALSAAEAEEAQGRLAIVLGAWKVPAGAALHVQQHLFALRLQEARRLAAANARAAQRIPLALLQKKIQQLRDEATDMSCRMGETLRENSRLIARESQELTQRLQEHVAAATDAAARAVPLLQVAASARAAIQQLVAAGEASESAFSCGMCMQLCSQPVTCVPCGHTFCTPCLLQHPQNVGRSDVSAVRHCPECRSSTCNAVVRVRALETLSGNFCFRQKELEELRRVYALLAKC